MPSKKGFTLLEILLVVGIIAILAGIVIIAINPGKQLASVRNTQRLSDLKQLNNAMTQFYIDKGFYPASTTLSTTTLLEVCNTGSASATTTAVTGASCGSLTNLSELVPVYLTTIPVDPSGASSTLSFIPTAYANTNGTGYKIGKSPTNQLNLYAPLAELSSKVALGNWIPISGLVAHYAMNDTNGTTVVDTTGNNNGTAIHNTSAMTTAGKVGTALSFNGVDDKINILNPNLGQNFTISTWFKSNQSSSVGTYKMLFSSQMDNTDLQIFFNGDITNAPLVVSIENDEKATSFTLNNNLGVWHHMVWVRNANYSNVYVDGNNVLNVLHNTPLVNDYNYSIGGISGNLLFNGSIDDFRIYNRALSSDEISQIYNNRNGTEME